MRWTSPPSLKAAASGWSEGLMERRFAVIADNIERLRDGRPLTNQVHPAG
jgi:hypothetical protein